MYRQIGSTVATLFAVAILSHSTARALVIHGEASAFGVSVDTAIVDQTDLTTVIVNATLSPTPSVSGTAPPPFNLSDTLLQASVSAGSLLNLGGGTIQLDAATASTAQTLHVTASSDVDGLPGPRNADATASVEGLSIDVNLVSLASLLDIGNLFSFDAALITSEAHVSGDFGALVATGDSVLVDSSGVLGASLIFSVLGVDLDVAVDAQGRVPPNTTLNITSATHAQLGDNLGADLEGQITVILNEQIVTGDGITSAGITVNAMRILFENAGAEFFNLLGISVGGTNLVTGEIIVAQSHALLVAIPEPGSLALLGLGCLGLLAYRRRHPDG